jgi:ABC-type multidrug transport system ATPase subunit
MRAGHVVFAGTIDEMRAQAPAPSYRLRTSDNDRAVALAGTQPGVVVEHSAGEELVLHARPGDIDAYAITLGKSDIAVRALEVRRTSLETLFLALTEEDATDRPTAEQGADRMEAAV